MNGGIDALSAAKIVPVVVLDRAEDAHALADALVAGGITCAEITLRTDAGLEAIHALRDRQDILVGAGTVLNARDVELSVNAGARFIVSPGFSSAVIDAAADLVTAIPGIATASELQAAVSAGISAVKLFPAGLLGGLSAVSAMAAPFPGVRFMPSGGVSMTNVAEYVSHPAVFAVGGSWMVPADALADRDWSRVEALSRATMEAISE